MENQDYSVNSAAIPASPGTTVMAFFTGQGAVNPPLATGAAAPMTPLSNVIASYSATIAGQPATATFAGLVPTLVGVAQMNITVPALAPGDYPLVLTVGGTTSNSGTISIGP